MTTTHPRLSSHRFVSLFRWAILPAFALVAGFGLVGCDDKPDDGTADADTNSTAAAPAGDKAAPPASATSADKPGGKPIAVTADNFEDVVLKSDKVVLVDYWATWCGPCKMVAPSVDKIAAEYSGRVVVAKLDVDVAGPTAEKYGVKVLPTLMVFKGGKVVDTVPQDRLPSQQDIVRVLEKHL